MKKVLALALTAAMAFSLVACGSSTPAPAPAAKTFKTGLGMVVSASTSDATEEADGQAQINTTIAVVTFDEEGKVVSATLDVAQQTLKFDAEGKATSEVDLRTKAEKGADYGMKKASGIGKEVDEQMAAMADWMVGKTVEEIVSVETYAKDDHHTAVPAEGTDLAAGVTISIGDYLAAVQKAWDNAEETTGEAVKTGLGTSITASVSDATEEADGQVQINTNTVGAAFDAEGKVVAATVDVAQQTVKFSNEGKIVGEVDLRTKVEKGDDYGMRKVSTIGAEVGEQYEALGEWMEGQTAEEIVAVETYQRDESHTAVPAEGTDLAAGVTISIDHYLHALEKAFTAAK